MSSRRKTITYQSQAVYVGPSPATGYHFYKYIGGEKTKTNDISDSNGVNQLFRVQSVSYSSTNERVPVTQMGEIAPIDRVTLLSPTVSLEVNYLLSNFRNERSMGFYVNEDISAIKDILGAEEEKNYFIKIVGVGEDAVDLIDYQNDNINVFAFGNMVINSYQSSAAVGSFATVSIGLEGQNFIINEGSSGNHIPAIDKYGNLFEDVYYTLPTTSGHAGTGELSVSAFSHGDITMTIRSSQTGFLNKDSFTNDYRAPGVNLNNACIQSYDLSFDLNRSLIDCLGNRFSKVRKIDGPIELGLSVDVIVSDLTTGSISEVLNCKDEYDVSIKLHKPICCCGSTSSSFIPTSQREVLAHYFLKGIHLEAIDITSDIGSNKTATINFVGAVGATNPLTNKGLFLYDPYYSPTSTGIGGPTEEQLLCAFIGDSGFLDIVGSGGYDSFDCYDLSENADSVILNLHSGWETIWVTAENYIGLRGMEDFDAYDTGDVVSLNGGSGYMGAYSIQANFSGAKGEESFEDYPSGEIESGTSQISGLLYLSSGIGWSGNWLVEDNL